MRSHPSLRYSTSSVSENIRVANGEPPLQAVLLHACLLNSVRMSRRSENRSPFSLARHEPHFQPAARLFARRNLVISEAAIVFGVIHHFDYPYEGRRILNLHNRVGHPVVGV